MTGKQLYTKAIYENFGEPYNISIEAFMHKAQEAMYDLAQMVKIPEWQHTKGSVKDPDMYVDSDTVLRVPEVHETVDIELPADFHQALKWLTLTKVDQSRARFFLAKAAEVIENYNISAEKYLEDERGWI